MDILQKIANSNGRARLADLRKDVWADRSEVDEALLDLQDEDKIVLYRNDNTASLQQDDHDAALIVGGKHPRHLAYIIGK